MQPHEVLDFKMNSSLYDDHWTLRDLFYHLLCDLWLQDERFSSKRPFGNSGWKYDVYAVLIRNGAIPGSLDADGYVSEIDTDAADLFVMQVILTPLFGKLV